MSPVVSARNLDTWFDAHLEMESQRGVTALSITWRTYVILENIYPENQLKNYFMLLLVADDEVDEL